MQTQTLHYSAASLGHRPLHVPSTTSWLGQWRVRCRRAMAHWLAQRRAARAYRQDLAVLARMGQRELDDFGAPAWLRADVQRYR
ncbi:MAG: hypothetical protein ABJA61_02025 [Caldimonas sp.]